MAGSPERRTRATVRWETAVREEKELDSSIVTTLDSGCTGFIVESQTLQSGRERCKIDEPVRGWVSRLLLEEAVESDDEEEESVSPEPSKKRATGLSSNERVAVISLRGNDRCFHCFARIEGLWCVDGERAYGCASKGIVACSACGIGRNYWSLEDDAWAPYHVAALCLGGNGRLRHHLESVGASDPAVSAPYVSAYAEHLAVAACDAVKASLDYEAHWLDDEESSMRNRRDACVKLVASSIESRDVTPDHDERAVELRTNDGKLGLELAEVHGGRCAVIKCSAWTEAVRPGDYVVAVGERRCWRYAPVVKAIAKAKKRGIVKLLLRRVAVVQPELEQKEEPPTSATNEAWASQKQNGSQSKVQSYCAFRRPCTPRRRRAAHAVAAPPTPSRAQGTRVPRSPSTARTARSPPSRTRCDPCPQSRRSSLSSCPRARPLAPKWRAMTAATSRWSTARASSASTVIATACPTTASSTPWRRPRGRCWCCSRPCQYTVCSRRIAQHRDVLAA